MNGKKIGLKFVIIAIIMVIGLTACTKRDASSKAVYNKITAEKANTRIKENPNIIVVDVRTEEEYKESHIPNSILIPNETIGTEPLEKLPDLNAEIFIYCRSGNRSKQAAEKLLEIGYTNVFDFGGIEEWPYETASGLEEDSIGSFTKFTATDLEGNTVTEEVFADYDLTMINIWGTFCSPCLEEMPDLGEIHMEYKEKGVQLIGIVIDVQNEDGSISQSQVDLAKEIVEKTNANYTHLLPSSDLILAKLQYVSAVPETIFVDRTGNLVGDSYSGSRSKEKWEEIINSMLEKK